jgi:hypothetical protein
VTVEISGEVGCWFLACGSLVGVSSFRKMCEEFVTRSVMMSPR